VGDHVAVRSGQHKVGEGPTDVNSEPVVAVHPVGD
jgi:hypothetical protein